MKQLSKVQSAIFLLGGVLMVVGAGCFAFGFIHPQMLLYTCWVFLLGTVLFSVMQSIQLYEGKSMVIHRLKRIQAVADICFVLSGISMVGSPIMRPTLPIFIISGFCCFSSQPCWSYILHIAFQLS